MDGTATDAIMVTQMAAAERVERARFEVRLAESLGIAPTTVRRQITPRTCA